MSDWLSADEAALRLGVSRQTLYAYVSRGLLRSHVVEGARGSRYREVEVVALHKQRASARQPRQAARATLDFGLPVLSSSLSLIHRGRLYYRGQDAVALSASATLEDTAALLWPCDVEALRVPALRAPPGFVRWSGLAAYHALCARLPTGVDETPTQAMQLVWLMASALLSQPLAPRARTPVRQAEPVHRVLQRTWRLAEGAAETLRATLVLCADHELNASSFAARCVASTGARLPVCVGAGLAALTGPRHGGMTERVEAWLDQGAAPRRTGSAPVIPGFGHTLYPDGDPRARAILARLPDNRQMDGVAREVQRRSGLQPSLDFALVALRRSLGLPRGSAFALFAIARTVGWIAHVLEQQRDGGLIRPRAAYVGVPPTSAGAPAPTGRVIRRR